jgi:hypothetical protein
MNAVCPVGVSSRLSDRMNHPAWQQYAQVRGPHYARQVGSVAALTRMLDARRAYPALPDGH